MAGRPIARGTPIPVERAPQHPADTPDLDALFAAVPHLTVEDVQACLTDAGVRQRGAR